MVNITLKNISKSFKEQVALKNISLEIKDKEYFIILGPTGSGKTTLVKVIAGLVKPDSGEVLFDNKDMTNKPPLERNLGFMFENYALFPHMTIYNNIAYSARVHARDPEITHNIVEQMLLMTLLTGRNDALPEEMSGGMKQRVALCRALMNLEQTKLLILDEPLKALDAGLRMSLRRDLLQMAKSKLLELSVIHITNEENEAMMVADRIAVINHGKLIQVGTPYEIYYQPKTLFVANFMSEINYFEGIGRKNKELSWDIHKKSNQGDIFFEKIHKESIPLPIEIEENITFVSCVQKELYNSITEKDKILLVIRANHMKIRLGNRIDEKHNAITGKISRRKFMGVFYRFEVIINFNDKEKVIIVTIPATSEIHDTFLEDLNVTIYFPKELGIVFMHPGKDEIDKVLRLE
ncbi:MAG: ABC transporter ATP-binding protein [Candidatus Lokiarchaeota archaeon]|nr:ABC transporter ATP-binding protein [Candidatus Lokiarchaeota archaeon]